MLSSCVIAPTFPLLPRTVNKKLRFVSQSNELSSLRDTDSEIDTWESVIGARDTMLAFGGTVDLFCGSEES